MAITWQKVVAAQKFLQIRTQLVKTRRMVYHLYDFASGPYDHILPKITVEKCKENFDRNLGIL